MSSLCGASHPPCDSSDSGYTDKRASTGEMRFKKYSDAKCKLAHPHGNILLCCTVSLIKKDIRHGQRGRFNLAEFGKHSQTHTHIHTYKAPKGSTSQTACVSAVNNICWLPACMADPTGSGPHRLKLAVISYNLEDSSYYVLQGGL